VILELRDAFLSGTASTAEELISRLHPVTDDLGAAGDANGSEETDGAFETVKRISFVVF